MPEPLPLFKKIAEMPRDQLTSAEIVASLLEAVGEQLEQCAVVAEQVAARFTASGKDDCAMVAIEIAAKIRDRKPK